MNRFSHVPATVLTVLDEISLQYPTQTALVFGTEQLNYQTLHERSERLANYLKTKGSFFDTPICFCLEQSIDKVVVMLAIWKAGGAYVSLDPVYPQIRLRHILEDTRSPLLITTIGLAPRLSSFQGDLVIIDSEQEAAVIETMTSAPSGREKIYDGLAYLAYTSGSTGLPKAVMAEHKGLANFVQYFGAFLNARPGEIALNISSSGFDGIVLDLWVPLSLGMTVNLYPDNRIVGDALLDFICKNDIMVLPYLPVSILATLPYDGPIGKLRKICTGGEAPSAPVVRRWKKKVTLVNIYGPTETTVVVSGFEFSDTHPLTTIGKPLENVAFYVLDEQLHLLPEGETGQLYIGGIQVSRGYLNRPELTAERFVNYYPSPGIVKRVYKTGDLARVLPDGTVAFVGRADQQVKVRGFRVELTEIEENIRHSGLVEQCCVVVKGENPDDKRLVCYYKNNTGVHTYAEQLRTWLFEHLPAYMIPARFLIVQHFPLTSNGKIDRAVLSTYEAEEYRQYFVAPVTELQEQLAQIWSAVLSMKTVGINDNFFHFGGNSILAYKLVSAIRKQLHLSLQISDFFLYPTISELADRIADKEQESPVSEFITATGMDQQIPLSAQQHGLWFLDKLHGSLPYHIGALYPVNAAIAAPALEKAFRMLLYRHSILRTVITEEEDGAYQSLISPDNWQLQQLYDATPFQELLDIPIDLKRDYMLSAYLVNKAGKPESLFIIIHHIATDGWSMPLLIKELNELYLLVTHQKETGPGDTVLQYRDYAYWQLHHAPQARLAAGMLFWKDYLRDVPLLQLPHDFPKPDMHHRNGSQYRFMIDQELSSALHKLSEDNHVTLYMTLLSAFGLLMQQYSGQNDICIGSPAANRTPSTVDNTIGYFTNMLPVRIRINGNPVYKHFLQEIRKMLPLVFQHQEVPLETVINQAVTDRYAGYNPLFQTVFILQDAYDQHAGATPVDAGRIEWIYNGKTKFDLQFEVVPVAGCLRVVIEYATALFKEETIVRMATDFQSLLRCIVRDPQKKTGQFELSAEIPYIGNETGPAVPSMTLVGLIEEQVNRTPAKTALTLAGVTISYQELNDQAGRIADQLIAMGIRSGQFVACYMEQSIERVSCLLGIIKAGAAYVPLDTAHPPERINVLLQDTIPPVLITTYKYREISEQTHTPVLYIEDLLSAVLPAGAGSTSYTGTHCASDLVYVIHTSGTTGIPKGVLIEHRSVSNFIAAYSLLLDITAEDRTMQFSPYNFDGSVIDLWIPLTKGATIHLYPNNKLLGTHLSDFLQLHAITVIPFISPSVLSTIPEMTPLPLLKVIGTGGEACPAALSRHWRDRVKLVNGYGPTEATVAVNQYVYDGQHPANTLGRPVRNMRFYVLDAYKRPVPVGVTGELYLSGIQLSRGYLNQPELTAEKFTKNHFIKEGDPAYNIYNRLYPTGDQVKILPDGMIEYMGRADQQVKIRGYRIEITEIESVLHQIDEIQHAVVQVLKSSDNIMSLRAFVTGNVKTAAIRKELSRKLPAYMIPGEIIPVKAVPVTANGKMDMAALDILASDFVPEVMEEEMPYTNYEQTIRNVWCDVLQRNTISREDDFFHIGGHSMLLTKLYNRLSEHFPNKISLSELYVNSTIGKVARLIEERALTHTVTHYGLGTDPLSCEIRKDASVPAFAFNANLSRKGNFSAPEAILLTGVTGFVGVNMLTEFMASTTAVIYLLIRADDEQHAAARLQTAIRDQLLPASLYNEDRIRLLAGDLSKPLLGLSQDMYDELANVIDVIYHAGSSVNFIQPYSYMKAANVDALHLLIKLATTTRLKQISLLSTVGVFSWEHYFTKPKIIMETTPTASAFKYLSLDMGYIQSKWVMEQIAMQAIQQGVPIIIFRLGYVFCHSLTGATAKYQWWGLLVKTCVLLKYYPILEGQKEELVSVDFVSKAITHISANPDATGQIFHLSPSPEHNITVMDFFETLRHEFGIELEPMPYQDWMKLWENDENSPLYPLLSLFKFKVYDNKAIIEIHQHTPDFDISNTMKFIAGSNIDNTVVNRDMLAAYCKYLGIR